MSDILFGAVGLVIFLAVAFVGGYLLYKVKNARFSKAWGPLVQLVDGKVVGDGGGGATSWLVGIYKGRKVQAGMVPDRNMYSSDDSSNAKYNYFEVALSDEPGKHDWSVTFDRKFLGLGQEGWRVQTKDPMLEAGLKDANVISLVSAYGEPASHFDLPPLEFVRREGLLRYRYDAGSSWTPSVQVFAQHLEMLLKVAEINKQVNPA
jgi:hypothetical protein